MRFMMFVRADKNTEAGVLPTKELVAEGIQVKPVTMTTARPRTTGSR
jgi:hypothetical protein